MTINTIQLNQYKLTIILSHQRQILIKGRRLIIKIAKILLIIICASLFCFTTANSASRSLLPDDQDIADALTQYDARGTMIISSLNNQTAYIYNTYRANLGLSPASTFKITNSIIAINEGVLKDQYVIIKWDKKQRFLQSWNKDQNLKSSFQSSCVWFYQELAKKIGKEKYLQYFDQLDYGNRLLGRDITTFWLGDKGDLKITPLEQIEFLRKIYKKQLPISMRTYDILQDIMLEEETSNYKIYSKSGAATKNWRGHGWYIGYITTKHKVWFFVTNILIDDMEDLSKRKAVTIEVLKKKNII